MTSPNVDATRSEYDERLPQWTLIRDCIAGATAVKAKKEEYLPKPNPSDTSEVNARKYRDYLKRAVFHNVTGRTLSGLSGQVFKKEPVIQVPDVLKPIIDDADGAGVPLWQQSKKTVTEVLAFSRAGLLVDYPQMGGVASRADVLAGSIRPTIIRYPAESIINWRLRKIGGVYRHSLIVLKETHVVDDDGFEETEETLWRVLRLDETNQYKIEEWVSTGSKTNPEFSLIAEYFPVNSRGQRFQYIPFTFCGSVNNDSEPDPPLLYDMAELNIAHYRNSADYEQSCFIVGQPTPYFSGLTKAWVEDVLKGEVQIGATAAVPLPENGSAGIIQVSPNSMPKEAMDLKEKQMVAIGAKLIENSNVERTRAEVIIRDFGEHANLTIVSKNVSDAYTIALQHALDFVSDTSKDSIKFELNRDLEFLRLDANEQAQLVAMWQSGAIVEEEMRNVLRRTGIAHLGDEDFRDRRDDEGIPDFGAPAGADQNLLGE